MHRLCIVDSSHTLDHDLASGRDSRPVHADGPPLVLETARIYTPPRERDLERAVEAIVAG